MQTDIVNIALGFIEGFGLIISPCILPILPFILSGSLTGSRKRPYGIIVGFVLVFALFTFFSRTIVRVSGIDLNWIRYLSYGFLLLFGVVMISTYLTEKFTLWTSRLANAGSHLKTLNDQQGGFLSGILFGGMVAIIWTPCAGPILAAVIVQTVIQNTTLASFFVVLAFGVGAALPMLVIVLFGRKIMTKVGFFKKHAIAFRKILGVIIIASVGYMIYSEGATVVFAASSTNTTSTNTGGAALTLQNEGLTAYPAPPLVGLNAWINSPPLTLDQLKGKVVLIDFWTYSCINCLRTLPYLKDWYNKYHDKGLVIIGVHTPEFDFEKNLENVKAAVAKDGILYPVALDSDYKTWQSFQNQYWPAHYLIDKNGNVVYQHFGEGSYDVTENNIRYLLGLKQSVTAASDNQPVNADETPETYVGFARQENFASPETVAQDTVAQYSFPNELPDNGWGLQGAWKIMKDRAQSIKAGDAIKIHFKADKVFMVMGSATGKPVKVKVLLNGEQLIAEKGKNVTDSSVVVDSQTIYEIVSLPQAASGVLQITAESPGLEVYTFTFG